ncbi:MAG: outer membrane lipoprotein-sorting protein [Limnochordales bacterium]
MKSAFRRAVRGAGWAAVWAALAWTALGAGGLGAARAAEADMEAILRAVDAQSNFEDADFSAVMTIISQDPEKGTEKMVVRQFRRDREEKFLLLIQEPKANRGQGYLMDGDSLWFYDPESRQFSHTSLKEHFAGSDARTDDFSRSSLADDYRVAAWEPGRLGIYDVYIIELEAVRDDVPDPFLKIWVTQDTNLVLKMESYSLTKRLMRTALFPNYARVGDKVIPRVMLFVDELVEGRQTQVTLEQISLSDLSDTVFTKAFVERAAR